MKSVIALLAAAVVAVSQARADSGVTNDPDKLDMILLPRALDVMAVQPEPIYGCTCHPPVLMGDRCHLPQGVGMRLRGTDRTYVLLEYPAWTDAPGATCPRGTMILMTRAEFKRRAAPEASRRLPAERLLAIVRAIIENARKRHQLP